MRMLKNNTTFVKKQHSTRRKRLKESFSFIIKHIDNADMLRNLTNPVLGLLGDGPLALDYIKSRCRTAMDVVDTQDNQAQWQSITIAKDIGVNENTIMELDTMLMTINDYLPPGRVHARPNLREDPARDRRSLSHLPNYCPH